MPNTPGSNLALEDTNRSAGPRRRTHEPRGRPGLRHIAAPRAILAFSGALIAPESLAKELSNHAPVLLVHGEADEVVPVARSRDAEAALKAAAVPVEAHYIPRLGHGIDDTGLSFGALALQKGFS